tara:strand:+ start:382 stop:1320 length:939 start_codon:yes stop_codon:yes gene_type:complete
MKLITRINRIFNTFDKLTIWKKSIILLAAAFIIFTLYRQSMPCVEGFEQREKFVSKEGDEVYDQFYTTIYDTLFTNPVKSDYEIKEILKKTGVQSSSKILEIGSKTGHVVDALSKKNLNAIGIDKSQDMVNKAKKDFGNNDYRMLDPQSSIIFPENYFTHILALQFMAYTMKDKQTFLQNCYYWLKPGGYLVLHLVNRDRFDPILSEANPIHFVSPQKYAKERITKSTIKFNNFTYKANYEPDNAKDMAYFNETIIDDKTKKTRKNKHVLYMPSQEKILTKAKNVGFILKHKIDLVQVEYEYQYLYILYKPS